jgi:CBS domain-containing protein
MSPTTGPASRIDADGPVSLIMRRSVAAVREERTVREVAEELAADEVGAVLVDGPHGPVGILSERDVVVFLGSGGDPDQAQAADLMTPDVLGVAPGEPIRSAGARMLDGGIRHLPVWRDGRVVGLVSLRDVAGIVRPRGSRTDRRRRAAG